MTKQAFLTFDDGPLPGTLKILKVLKQHRVRGLFFVVGSQVFRWRGRLMAIANAGHMLGNHTYTHGGGMPVKRFLGQGSRAIIGDFEMNHREWVGMTRHARFPYANTWDPAIQKHLEPMKKAGFTVHGWDVDVRLDDPKAAEKATLYVMQKLKRPATLLLHDWDAGRAKGLRGLDQFLRRLKRAGVRFVLPKEG